MIRMGRPREKDKHMPPGMRKVGSRWYWRPTNEESRRAMVVLAPGRNSVPAGEDNHDKEAARRWWAEKVLPALTQAVPDQVAQRGTLAELLDRAEREILPTLSTKGQEEWRRYIKTLRAEFGARRYAKSEAEAATGNYLRAMDLTNYLDRQANLQPPLEPRPVAANREVQALSRIFTKAKSRWGYTEYNPCLNVEYNEETPRRIYQPDENFLKVYAKASPVLQVMMDIAQTSGPRRGMLLKLNLGDIEGRGVLITLNKKRRGDAVRRQLLRFVDDQGADTGLRAIVDRALELRKKARGGGKVADLASAPLFLNLRGHRWTETGFNSAWQRAARAAGFGKHEFHFHDIRVKSLSDSPTVEDAQDRGGHLDGRTTRGTYRAKPVEVTPLKRVSEKGKD
jgi:hypothetical protein